ncbi:MAG TPA: Crp/Fnr family transcriptional regulator [Rectinemataceae bacterium]
MDLRDQARLCSCSLFAGIDPRSPGFLAPLASLQPRVYTAGNMILLAGCKYSSLHILLEGEAWAEMASEEGRVVRVESFSAVEALAAAILFTPSQRLPVSVVARTTCRIVAIPKDILLDLCSRHRPVLEAILAETGSRLESLADRMRSTQFSTLKEKLADWLLRRLELAGDGSIRLEASRERMAELFGVARPSLSRTLMAMRDEGLIDFSGRIIRIRDPKSLAEIRNGGSGHRLRRTGR